MELPLALMAVLKAGGAYMPCDAAYPAGRLLHYLRQSAAKVVVTRREAWERSGLEGRLAAGVQVRGARI
jgi:non-ribosomal peptide synthetase component F